MATGAIRFQAAIFLVAILVQPSSGQSQRAAPRPAADAGAYARDGLAHYKSGRFREAADALQKAARLKPDDSAVHYNLGMCYVRLGRYVESIAPLREALRLNPEHAEVYPTLGVVYNYFGEYREAVLLLKRAARSGRGGADVYNNLGIAYYHLGQYNDAAEALNRAITLAPELAPPYRNLSNVYHALGRHKEAREAQERADRLAAAEGGATGRLLFVNDPRPNAVKDRASPARRPGQAILIAKDGVGGEGGGEETNDNRAAGTGPVAGGGDTPKTVDEKVSAKPTPGKPPAAAEAATSEKPAAAVQPVGQKSAATPAGEAGAAPGVTSSGPDVVSPRAAESEELASTALYRVGVDDVLDIRLLNSPVAGATLYPVLAGGLLDYPLAGEPVRVGGLTTAEIEERLSSRIKLHDRPRVVVAVRDYNSHTVLVSGLVETPGAKVLRREAVPLYVVMADAQPKAEAGRVLITSHDGRRREVALDDSESTGTLIRPGDVLTFQGRPQQFFYVGGGVKQPGEKAYRAGVTLTQAILTAGGLTRAAGDVVDVSRVGADGLLVTSRYRLRKINSGKIPDPEVRPGDRIVVRD